jgi:hypothetical protein
MAVEDMTADDAEGIITASAIFVAGFDAVMGMRRSD